VRCCCNFVLNPFSSMVQEHRIRMVLTAPHEMVDAAVKIEILFPFFLSSTVCHFSLRPNSCNLDRVYKKNKNSSTTSNYCINCLRDISWYYIYFYMHIYYIFK
jgi:hypothetical protein